MRKFYALFAFVVLLAALFAACAPQTTTAPSMPQLSPAPVSVSSPNLPPPIAEDPAWQKVVETAKKEGKVVLYSFSFTGGVGVQLAKAFEERYGISVDIITGPGAQFIERIKTEQRAKQIMADVMEGASANANLAQQDGLSASYGEIPVLKEKDVWLIQPDSDPARHVLYYSPILTGPWINTNLVKADEAPRSWRQLVEPRWRGKLVASDPDITPTPNVFFVMLKRLGFDDNYFKALAAQQLILTPTAWQPSSILARGEAHILIAGQVINIAPVLAEKAPVKPIDMEEGLFARAQALNILANAPHPNAARLFLNWSLTEEGQTVQARAKTVLSLRRDVPDFTPEQGRITPRKVFTTTLQDELEIARVQREKTFHKILGY